MPSLVATYNVRYVWTLPEGVLLLEQYDPLNRPENEGSYYIRYDVLHYVWKGNGMRFRVSKMVLRVRRPMTQSFMRVRS